MNEPVAVVPMRIQSIICTMAFEAMRRMCPAETLAALEKHKGQIGVHVMSMEPTDLAAAAETVVLQMISGIERIDG